MSSRVVWSKKYGINYFQSLYYFRFCSTITLRITRLYKWEGQGLKLEVREESFLSSVENCSLDVFDLYVQPLWAARMISFPQSSSLNHCTVKFQQPHLSSNAALCCDKECKIPFWSEIWHKYTSQRDLPYKGVFNKCSSFGMIQLSHFCCTAIAGHKDTPRLYCAHLYHTKKKRMHDWRVNLAIIQDHPVRNITHDPLW